MRARRGLLVVAALLAAALCGCETKPPEITLTVTATGYSSTPGQTWGDPHQGAWGDRLQPGDKAIAVSRDLLDLGLNHGAKVRIHGLPGTWTVLDKMNRRWEKRIDIYFGKDTQAAREWGRRTVKITYRPVSPS